MDAEHTRDVARVFDGWARSGRDEGMEQCHRLTAAPVLEALCERTGRRLVDLGTGNGWAARRAREAGLEAVGVDAARRMLVRGQRLAPRVPLVQADFTALPFPDRCFELAFSMETLYYAEELDQALSEVRRILVPGGELHALIDFYEGNPASAGWEAETGVPMHRLPPDGWVEALERAGFEDAVHERIRSDAEAVADWKAEHGSLYVRGRRPA